MVRSDSNRMLLIERRASDGGRLKLPRTTKVPAPQASNLPKRTPTAIPTAPQSKIATRTISAPIKKPEVKTPSVQQREEISRLEALCEARTKECTYLKLQLRHNTNGFTAFAALLQHALSQVDAAKLDREHAIERLVQQRDENLNVARLEHETLAASLKFQHAEEIRLLQEQIASKELLLHQQNGQADSARTSHEEQLRQISQAYEQKLAEAQSALESKITELQHGFQEESASIREERDDLLQKWRETAVELSKDNDSKTRVLAMRCSELENELESHKVVIDINKGQIAAMRKENERFQGMEEKLTRTKEERNTLRAKVEELTAVIQQKRDTEKDMYSRHEELQVSLCRSEQKCSKFQQEMEEMLFKMRSVKNTQELSMLFEDSSTDIENLNGDEIPIRPSPITYTLSDDSILQPPVSPRHYTPNRSPLNGGAARVGSSRFLFNNGSSRPWKHRGLEDEGDGRPRSARMARPSLPNYTRGVKSARHSATAGEFGGHNKTLPSGYADLTIEEQPWSSTMELTSPDETQSDQTFFTCRANNTTFQLPEDNPDETFRIVDNTSDIASSSSSLSSCEVKHNSSIVITFRQSSAGIPPPPSPPTHFEVSSCDSSPRIRSPVLPEVVSEESSRPPSSKSATSHSEASYSDSCESPAKFENTFCQEPLMSGGEAPSVPQGPQHKDQTWSDEELSETEV